MITLIKDILTQKPDGQEVAVYGWVRTKRETKNLIFIQVNDGSCFASIQLTFDRDKGIDAQTEKELSRITTGASIKAVGALIESPASGQAVEVAAKTIFVYGEASGETYPLQKKRHTFEFLRDIAHLRARTNTFGAVARVRNQMAFAVHNFFQEHGFQYVHTPLITASDCEGAGEMFQVTTLNMQEIIRKALKDKVDPATFAVDYKQDFFEREAYLTVSGQLEIETYATALSRVYTFGPTFRAENSNTTRHLSEFWMIEPEMSFFRLEDNMDLAEKFVVYLLKWALTHCRADLEFFNAQIKPSLIETLEHVVESKFTRITYTDAVKELEKHASEFEFKPFWGCDLQSEHEKYLTEQVFKGPVIVTDYPKEIKAFYMKQNDDGKTVRAMDVLVPGLGEIIGGSEREDDLAALETRMTDLGLDVKNYWWYLDLRRYGTVPHSGFGLGFDRLLLYVTGMANIRDVIPYPRTPKSAEF
nr:asparagine--tRNA ligase [uncultured Treponema sp.]